MKTDKLLKLIQQKKAMRSGGALPLPKHQSRGKVAPFITSDPVEYQRRQDAYRDSALVQRIGQEWIDYMQNPNTTADMFTDFLRRQNNFRTRNTNYSNYRHSGAYADSNIQQAAIRRLHSIPVDPTSAYPTARGYQPIGYSVRAFGKGTASGLLNTLTAGFLGEGRMGQLPIYAGPVQEVIFKPSTTPSRQPKSTKSTKSTKLELMSMRGMPSADVEAVPQKVAVPPTPALRPGFMDMRGEWSDVLPTAYPYAQTSEMLEKMGYRGSKKEGGLTKAQTAGQKGWSYYDGQYIPQYELPEVEVSAQRPGLFKQMGKRFMEAYNPMLPPGSQAGVLMEALSAPQKAMMYGITGQYDHPSNIYPTKGIGNFGNKFTDFMFDVLLDPTNLLGLGALTKEQALARLAASKESGLLSNAYKINPWAIKENPEMFLYRARPVGQDINMNMAAQLRAKQAAGEPLTWYQKNLLNPQTNPELLAREKYYGQWFEKDPNRLDWYIDPTTRNFADNDAIEILRTRLPKSEAAKLNISQFPDAKVLSASPETEFILPKDIIESAERFPESSLQQLIQEHKKFNTPNWLRGYKAGGLAKAQEGRSYYDPFTDEIHLAQGNATDDAVKEHELYHRYQNMVKDSFRVPEYYPGPLKKPVIPINIETNPQVADYYNRKGLEIEMFGNDFLNQQPSFMFAPRDLIYNRVIDPQMYDPMLLPAYFEGDYPYPYTIEAEAQLYENAVRDGLPKHARLPNEVRYKKGGLPKHQRVGPTGQNTVTSADSAALYNNTIALLNYFSTKNKYKNIGSGPALPSDIHSINSEAVKQMIKDLKNPTTHPYTAERWNSRLTTAGNLLSGFTGIGSIETDHLDPDYDFELKDYYQNVDKNKYKQRELANRIIDTNAPMALYDRRITPTVAYQFENRNNEYSAISGTNPLFGDIVNFYGYDPNLIKPWHLLTPAEKVKRQKLLNSNNTQSTITTSRTPVVTSTPRVSVPTSRTPVVNTIPVAPLHPVYPKIKLMPMRGMPSVSTEEAMPQKINVPSYTNKLPAQYMDTRGEWSSTPQVPPGYTEEQLLKMGYRAPQKKKNGGLAKAQTAGIANPLLNIPESQRFPKQAERTVVYPQGHIENRVNPNVPAIPLNAFGQPLYTGAIEPSASPIDLAIGAGFTKLPSWIALAARMMPEYHPHIAGRNIMFAKEFYEDVKKGLKGLKASTKKSGGLAKAQPGGKKNSLYNALLNYKESPDEDKVEFFDISGLTSWDDAVKGYDSWKTSNRTYPTISEGMDMFSAVPLFGRAKKVDEGLKYIHKSWRPAVDKLYGLVDYIRETYDKSKEEKQIGGLAKAQTGLPKGFKTYQSDPEYFNSHAVLHDDPRYNEQVKELIYSGKAAYNPATGELWFIDSTPAPADVRQMSTREYTEGVRRDPTDPRFAGADKRTKQIIQESTRQAYENPLMYAPGSIGMVMLPATWGTAYGLTQAGTQALQGNYGNAALTAGLSMLPVAGRITNNYIIPAALQSSLAKKVVAPQTLENLVGKNISLGNAGQYDPVTISRGAFGEAAYLKKFPNIIIKKSPSDRVFSVMGDGHLFTRFEDIPQKPGQLYPKYYKSQSRATFNDSNFPYEFEVMSRVSGKPVGELSTKQLSSIPKESWNSLLDELQFLREKDVGFDMVGANLLYDPKTAKFGMIDLSPGASKTKSAWQTHVLGDVSSSNTPQEARKKFKEALVRKLDNIFSKKDKIIKSRMNIKDAVQNIQNFQLMEHDMNNSILNTSVLDNNRAIYNQVRDKLNDRRYSLLNQLTGLKVGGLAKAQSGGKTQKVKITKRK